MSKNLIDCWLCGAVHEYCPTCGQTHGWKYSACTREHYQILMAKREYEAGVFTKEQAIDTLKQYGVTAESDLSWMIPEVEKEIRGIIGDKPIKQTKTIKKSETKSKLFD